MISNTVPQLRYANLDNGMVEVVWSDSSSSIFHPLWLRDNCRCESCGDPAIGYRNLRLTALDLDIMPGALALEPDLLTVSWPDSHRSTFTAPWLHVHAGNMTAREARVFKPRLWDQDFRDAPPRFDYAGLEDDDAVLLQVLQQVRDSGICLLQNAPTEPGVVEAFARRFGFPQESNFGRVQDLVFDPGRRSIANDIKALKLHTDEPYRASPPGLLLFHCIAHDQTGAGSSLFMDGFEIAEQLRARDPDGFEALCTHAQSYRRHFENDVDLIAEFPILSVDEFGNLCGIRLNDRVAAPLSIPPDQVAVFYRGLLYLLGLAEDDKLMMKITLQPGDIAIFDNHRILHGRSDLSINGQRWLQWVQIERGDFYSSLRIIADRLGLARDDSPLLRGAYGSFGYRGRR
ncbi:MAG: TauD/TfdA family dioxygenase [Gammaproteobacteria bacterium]|nr:TauD/TfdA family dioxygenase [Gammaproteobacteria bacterium]MDH3857659.1 TauD/TfdA family dioxygenase [Gammaproteobacteria bacterium]